MSAYNIRENYGGCFYSLPYVGFATNGQKEVDFVEAVERGLIEFQIREIRGIVSLDLRIRNKSTEDHLRIVILPGRRSTVRWHTDRASVHI